MLARGVASDEGKLRAGVGEIAAISMADGVGFDATEISSIQLATAKVAGSLAGSVRPPLHGRGEVILAGDERFAALAQRCAFDWARKKMRVGGPEALLAYQRAHNGASLDGLPAVELPSG